MKTTQLIWQLASVANPYLVEELLLQLLRKTGLREGGDRFGNFWRISEETICTSNHSSNMDNGGTTIGWSTAGLVFSRVLFWIINFLSHPDPVLRNLGESWIRNYVKSYLR